MHHCRLLLGLSVSDPSIELNRNVRLYVCRNQHWPSVDWVRWDTLIKVSNIWMDGDDVLLRCRRRNMSLCIFHSTPHTHTPPGFVMWLCPLLAAFPVPMFMFWHSFTNLLWSPNLNWIEKRLLPQSIQCICSMYAHHTNHARINHWDPIKTDWSWV